MPMTKTRTRNTPLDVEMHPTDEYRDVHGRLVKQLPGSVEFTSANARQMQAKSVEARRNRAMRSAQNRVAREAASIDPTVDSWYDAWGLAVSKQYTTLLDSDKPRGDDLLRIGQALGAVPLAGELREQDNQVADTMTGARDLLREIVDAVRRLSTIQPVQVIDMRSDETVDSE